MELVSILETASISMCGIATILWMAIGTLARFERGELLTQKIVAALCIISAVMLFILHYLCLLYTSPSPRDLSTSRMPSSA